MVSAFAARQRLVLGEVKVAEMSNDAEQFQSPIAIPKLLDLLAIRVRDIAQKVVNKKTNNVLALKGDPDSLREDVELFVAEQKAADFKDTEISRG
jgi:hypothetical protein